MGTWGLGDFFYSSLAVTAGFQKRLVNFLLQRAIGNFLEDDLDLEHLVDIELANGKVHLADLRLNARVSILAQSFSGPTMGHELRENGRYCARTSKT